MYTGRILRPQRYTAVYANAISLRRLNPTSCCDIHRLISEGHTQAPHDCIILHQFPILHKNTT